MPQATRGRRTIFAPTRGGDNLAGTRGITPACLGAVTGAPQGSSGHASSWPFAAFAVWPDE